MRKKQRYLAWTREFEKTKLLGQGWAKFWIRKNYEWAPHQL